MERTKPLIPGGENLNNHGVWFLECFFYTFCLNYAFKPLFLTSKKNGPPCPFRRGGGGSELNGQCPFKPIFFFLDVVPNILQPTLTRKAESILSLSCRVEIVTCAIRFNVFQPSSNLVLSICS